LKGTAENNKTAAALQFAQAVVEKHGQISDTDFQSVRAAGFSEGEIAEIVAQVALNIFTNYFNNVAKTEIDFPLVEVSVNA
jgi:alkylhydroperoxidase family enzyme